MHFFQNTLITLYIIAAPESHNIIFETTAPGNRLEQINDKMNN